MEMQNIILFTALVLSFCLGFDLDAYKKQHRLRVGIPYKHAVDIAGTEIIEYLATYPVPKSLASGLQVAEKLHILTERFRNELIAADQASDAIRVQLDKEVEQLVAQASNIEQQIAVNEKQLQEVNAQIQQANVQLTDAQNQVQVAQASVDHTQRVLDDENRRLHEAKYHCTGLFFIDWACGLLNSGGIRGAARARDVAQADLNNQRQRLNEIQGVLNQYVQRQQQLQQTRAADEATKAQLNNQLQESNKARDTAVAVDTNLKGLIAHLGTLLGKSQVLADVIKHLIDMETVIIPLQAIGDQIMAYSADTDDMNFYSAIKQKIASNLPLVQLKLPQYGLIHVG